MPVAKEIYHAMDDPKMQKMVIDTQEKRERILADGTKVPYLYVHGAIPENEIKFILCIPEKENYEGRFFQYLSPFPGPDEEVASLDKTGEDDRIAFALTHGAYFVESNMGSKFAFGGAADPTLCWKASAAVAEHSRKFVMDLYGVGRPYGYVYGGSGGGYNFFRRQRAIGRVGVYVQIYIIHNLSPFLIIFATLEILSQHYSNTCRKISKTGKNIFLFYINMVYYRLKTTISCKIR